MRGEFSSERCWNDIGGLLEPGNDTFRFWFIDLFLRGKWFFAEINCEEKILNRQTRLASLEVKKIANLVAMMSGWEQGRRK